MLLPFPSPGPLYHTMPHWCAFTDLYHTIPYPPNQCLRTTQILEYLHVNLNGAGMFHFAMHHIAVHVHTTLTLRLTRTHKYGNTHTPHPPTPPCPPSTPPYCQVTQTPMHHRPHPPHLPTGGTHRVQFRPHGRQAASTRCSQPPVKAIRSHTPPDRGNPISPDRK